MRIIALLTVPCAIAAALVFAVSRIVGDPKPPQATVPTTAVVWAGRVFVSRRYLAAWLRSNGASYKTWLKRHPPRLPAPARPAAPASTPTTAARSGKRESSGGGFALRWWLAAGGALGAVALLYRRIRRLRFRLPPVPQLRNERGPPRAPAASRRAAVPAVDVDGLREAFEPAVRGAHRTTYFLLRRRSDVAWVIATSSLAIAMAVLLPHL